MRSGDRSCSQIEFQVYARQVSICRRTAGRLGAPPHRPGANDLSLERPISAVAPPERGSKLGLVAGIRAALAGAPVARPPAATLRAPARCLLRWQRSASAIAISKALRRIAPAWPTPCKSRWRSCRRDRSSWCGRIRRATGLRVRKYASGSRTRKLTASLVCGKIPPCRRPRSSRLRTTNSITACGQPRTAAPPATDCRQVRHECASSHPGPRRPL